MFKESRFTMPNQSTDADRYLKSIRKIAADIMERWPRKKILAASIAAMMAQACAAAEKRVEQHERFGGRAAARMDFTRYQLTNCFLGQAIV